MNTDKLLGIGLIGLAAVAAVLAKDWAAAYYYQYQEPVTAPIPQTLPTLPPLGGKALYAAPMVDFGPMPPDSPAVKAAAEYAKAVRSGPRRPWLGARPCPLPGYHLRPGQRLTVFEDESMAVATNRQPFRIEKGASLVVRQGADLSVVTNCEE